MSTTAVITTHNEAATIKDLVIRLRRLPTVNRVIVVDERSGDQTVSEAMRGGAQVVEWSGGIGPCLLHGWKEALSYPDCSQILQIDAGGSHRVSDARTLLSEYRAAVVVGSRFCPGGVHDGPLPRQWGSKLYARMWRFRHPVAIRDWTSGLRLFSRRAVEYLSAQPYTATMHGWQAEVLAQALDGGFSVAEVPIHYEASRSSLTWGVTKEALRAWKDYR
jgi:glycosyltransferase involved in cell wall biosynthesis